MHKVGDRVLNQKNGLSGKVVGYGHQILDGVYLPTLIVRVFKGTGRLGQKFVEDLSSTWKRM